MALSGIERLSFEDSKYTDQQLAVFRNLYKLSAGNAQDVAKFKVEAVKLNKQSDLPLFVQYKKEAALFVQLEKKKQAELSSQIAKSEKNIENNETKLAKLDVRLAALDVKDKTHIAQFSNELGKKLVDSFNQASSSQSLSTTATDSVKTRIKQ